jgi:hypothetical protein
MNELLRPVPIYIPRPVPPLIPPLTLSLYKRLGMKNLFNCFLGLDLHTELLHQIEHIF